MSEFFKFKSHKLDDFLTERDKKLSIAKKFMKSAKKLWSIEAFLYFALEG
jgi:hypothetical protein